MIIYNNNKQFVGIDEENLKSLGYSNLASLQSEAMDFADLFVKTPGHIHNFKDVHWIDFILCSTDKSSSKAIIHANNKNFSCVLDIRTIYLSSAPTKESYIITLNNLRTLSAEEVQEISNELQTRVAPLAATDIPIVDEIEDEVVIESNEDEPIDIQETAKQESQEFVTESVNTTVQADPYEVDDEFNLDVFEPSQDELDEIGDADLDTDQSIAQEIPQNLEDHINIDDDLLEDIVEDTPKTEPENIPNEDETEEYIFNIQNTADALDMDVATIQDFVNDFIMQAKEFKSKLYDAVNNDDMDELKSLSHQLKGVAANLRIHDAQEILVTINKAENLTNSIMDLDTFYSIIAKLAGEEYKATSNLEIDNAIETDEDALEIDNAIEIDEDALEIKDDLFEVEEVEEDALEIDEDILEIDEFDLLDDEQDELIETKEQEEFADAKTSQLYDKKTVANEIGLDEDSFNELFEDYVNESKELVLEAKDAIESNSVEQWQHAAVKLKGMSDNMRVEAFKPEIEALITTQDATDAQNILIRLNKILLQIIEAKD